MIEEKLSDSGYHLFLFHTGQESSIADTRVPSETWRNRILMALANGTHEGKNCTEPGKERKLYDVL